MDNDNYALNGANFITLWLHFATTYSNWFVTEPPVSFPYAAYATDDECASAAVLLKPTATKSTLHTLPSAAELKTITKSKRIKARNAAKVAKERKPIEMADSYDKSECNTSCPSINIVLNRMRAEAQRKQYYGQIFSGPISNSDLHRRKF